MNPEYFHVFAGEEASRLEWEEILRRCRPEAGQGESLVSVQEDLHRRGFRSVQLVRSARGWTVRFASGLDDFRILYRCPEKDEEECDFGFSAAILAARGWCDLDPGKRYAFCSRKAWESQGREAI